MIKGAIESNSAFDSAMKAYRETCARLGLQETPLLALVTIKTQRLHLVNNGEVFAKYPVSTSKTPPSCVENSLGTPTGLHEIADKIGDGEPTGMVFEGRVPTGRLFSQMPPGERQKNLITTRIMRLRGLEPGANNGTDKAGRNVDSYNRYIYIHGTNHERKLSTPASAGCVQMSNDHVLDLFDDIEEGAHVWIS